MSSLSAIRLITISFYTHSLAWAVRMLHLSFRGSLCGSSATAPRLDWKLVAAWVHKLFQCSMPPMTLHFHTDPMQCQNFEDKLYWTLSRTNRPSQMTFLFYDLGSHRLILALPFRLHAGNETPLVHCKQFFAVVAFTPLFSASHCSNETVLHCKYPGSWFGVVQGHV